MTEGEGFQIVIWDVINKKKAEKASKKGEYINSGQVILKTINLEQVIKFKHDSKQRSKLEPCYKRINVFHLFFSKQRSSITSEAGQNFIL